MHGIPTTTPERAIIEMAPYLDIGGVARAVREALRTKCTTSADLLRAIDDHARRRGTRRVLSALSRHAGLPVSKAKSAAEIRALMVLRDANRSLPRLNDKVAGEEADLIWDAERLIIEIDGGPFHVYDAPQRLLQLAPTT